MKRNLEMVKVLLSSQSIKPNIVSDEGQAPLHKAHEKGCKEIMKELLTDSRIDPNLRDHFDFTPLHFAIHIGQLEIVRILLNSSEIDLNLLTDGQTPLHKAHEGGHKEIMIELLNDKRTKTNIPDKDGKIIADMITDPEILDYIKGPKFYEDIFCI